MSMTMPPRSGTAQSSWAIGGDPSNMKKKKRYFTPNQIRDEIDRYIDKMRKCEDSAQAYEHKARQFKEAGDWIQAEFDEKQAEIYRKKAKRIKDVRLVHLKQKLAEMNTELLPGVISDKDRSVQA